MHHDQEDMPTELRQDNSGIRFLIDTINHMAFEYFIMVLIIMSSIHLVLDSPLNDPNSKYDKILYYIDIGFTFLFVVEGIIKILSSGFLFSGPKSYLRNYWNCLDFLVICVSVIIS